jgi:hypothetical protein
VADQDDWAVQFVDDPPRDSGGRQAGERVAQRTPGRDPELGEQLVQVSGNRAG